MEYMIMKFTKPSESGVRANMATQREYIRFSNIFFCTFTVAGDHQKVKVGVTVRGDYDQDFDSTTKL